MCSFWFNVGLAGFGGWLLMAAYLILWVKYIKKYNGEWEDYWPQAIPIATFMAVSSLIAFVVAFWPVWGWLTIPAIFVLFLYAPRGLNPARRSQALTDPGSTRAAAARSTSPTLCRCS